LIKGWSASRDTTSETSTWQIA
jgi:hypothetical protein